MFFQKRNNDGLSVLAAAMVAVFSRPSNLTVWEWLEKNVTLTERESNSEPGRFSTRTRPYMREPLDCFRDKRVTDLVICTGTQIGKTMIVMGGACWKLFNDPMNALWVMPNRDLCASFSMNRWQPFVENSPLREQKPVGKDRHLWTKLEQFFRRCTLTFVGSNSPANLASRPAGLLLMDETDKFDLKSDREAGALQNAEERTKSFPYPLRVKTSTPTTKYGEIWQEFLRGDMRFYFVPCPRCNAMIRLMWKHVRWWEHNEKESKKKNEETGEWEWDADLVRKNTYYRCPECEGKILDGEKTMMLRGGEWRPQNSSALAGRRSYHLNSLYAPLKETQWGNLAVKWLGTKGSITRRHAFINSTLAEPWDDELAVDDDPINTSAYLAGELPADRIPICTIDVQEGHFWVVVRAWGNPKMGDAALGQQSWLLFADKIETVEELEAIPAAYKVEPRRVGVDIAHKTNFVSSLIVKNGWRGLWGSDKTGFLHVRNGYKTFKDYSPIQYRDPHVGTIRQGENNPRAAFIYWSNDRIKDRLAVARHAIPPRWHVHGDVRQDYMRHLNAEIKTTKMNPRTGRVSYYWKQVRRDNHLLDCEAMQFAMGLVGGVIEDEADKQANSQAALALTPEPQDY
jgi:DNA-directed RNA polymerase subunit RPC12/RpoP